jgi:hypothetical protein
MLFRMKTSALFCGLLAACGPAAVSAVPPPCAEPEPDVTVEVQAGMLQSYCLRTSHGRVTCHETFGDFTLAAHGARALAVAVGAIYSQELYACALLDGDRIVCGTSYARGETHLTGAQTIALGGGTVCAATTAGEVYCWDGTGETTPRRVEGVMNARRLAAGYGFVCALDAAGAVQCWGEDAPQPPAGLRATTLSAGMFHACALDTEGTVRCFGSFESAPAGEPAVAVGCGWDTTCWLNAGGRTTCAHDGVRYTPELPRLTTLGMGAYYVCGLDEGGEAACATAPR